MGTSDLSDNQMVFFIRQTPALDKLWNECTPDQRREILRQAEGDTWHLAELIEDVKDAAATA